MLGQKLAHCRSNVAEQVRATMKSGQLLHEAGDCCVVLRRIGGHGAGACPNSSACSIKHARFKHRLEWVSRDIFDGFLSKLRRLDERNKGCKRKEGIFKRKTRHGLGCRLNWLAQVDFNL